jgi:hypothetical protein
MKLIKLRPSDVSLMLQDLERRGYSPATERMGCSTLRRALRIAEQDGILGLGALTLRLKHLRKRWMKHIGS